MLHKDEIKSLIIYNERRLQKLKEQKALFGLHTPPYILIEIEDTEAEIQTLQAELEAAGDIVTSAPRITRANPPFILPRPYRDFVNRVTEVDALAETLLQKKAAGVFGMAGIGKTILATETVHRVQSEFSDGVIWHPKTLDWDTLANFLAGAYGNLAISNLDGEEKTGPLQLLLAGKQALIWLDDVEQGQIVSRLLDIAGQCAVLVTSRYHLDTVVPHLDLTLNLDSLPSQEAHQLFANKLDRSLTPTDKDAIEKICALIGYLPLAIELVTARARVGNTPLEEIISRLQHEKDVLNNLELENQGVRASFGLSYDKLDQTAQRLFTILGFFKNSNIGVSILRHVIDFQAHAPVLETLAIQSLIQRENGQIYIHPLLHLFAKEKLREQPDLIEDVADRILLLLRQSPDNQPRLRREIDWLVLAQTPKILAQYLNMLGIRWLTPGDRMSFLAYLPEAIATLRDADRLAEAATLMQFRASLHYDEGNITLAQELDLEALTFADRVGAEETKANILLSLSDLYRAEDNSAEAINLAHSALDISRKLDYSQGIAVSLGLLAQIHRDMGNLAEALDYAQPALELYESQWQQARKEMSFD